LNLYRHQLNALDKIAKLEDADLRQYDRRRDRIEELRKELESHSIEVEFMRRSLYEVD
jgi:IS4 transposase